MSKKRLSEDVKSIVDFVENEVVASVHNRLIKVRKLLYFIESRPRVGNNYNKLQWYLDELMSLNKLLLTEEALKAITKIQIAMESYEQGK